jgi:hypothetical protein
MPSERGPLVRTFFILGFPGESRAEMTETLKFAYDFPADWCNIGIAAPLIGTEMYDQLLERGTLTKVLIGTRLFFKKELSILLKYQRPN